MPTSPKTRKRTPKKPSVKVREFRAVNDVLAQVLPALARCEHEAPLVIDFLQSVYLAGFASGAISSRQTYSDWKPDQKTVTPVYELHKAAQEFVLTLRAIHSPLSATPESAN